MKKRWAPAFTIVELVIVVGVLAILVAIAFVAYNGVNKLAMTRAAQSDLDIVATEMQRNYQKNGEYPAVMPTAVQASKNIQLTLVRSGSEPFYSNVSTVQNGVLLAQICDDLIAEGIGNGTSQGGQVRNYITGCGNWNHGSMQVTGWNSKVWATPVSSQALLDYGTNFTASTTWDQDQERVVESFYTQLVTRLTQEGGSFPVNSFWDSWATPQNGGVQQQPLEANPKMIPFYCAQAQVNGMNDVIWHVTDSGKLETGPC